MGVSFPVGEWGFAPMPQKPFSLLGRFPKKPLVRSGQNSKFTLFGYRNLVNKLLVNNVFHNSEKWGFENFLVGHFRGVLPFYPLRGSGPPILFSIIIALGALRRTVFVWRESAHIWGRYGGLKSAILAYFGLFFLEILSTDFGFFLPIERTYRVLSMLKF